MNYPKMLTTVPRMILKAGVLDLKNPPNQSSLHPSSLALSRYSSSLRPLVIVSNAVIDKGLVGDKSTIGS